MMSTLNLFDDPEDSASIPSKPQPMHEAQRNEIRGLFATLGLSTAREQFHLVEELIGVRLKAVAELTMSDAQRLILRLRGRAAIHGRSNTGNSWADRDEDTWIDRL
ncbi:hypothetical protein [uncultured Microbacterium sp.]|uniref:hypothetical protein n=1 Tax=uncultured Microbacterium sp. TaxID=191216 RepID=UPI00261F8222|nr:hypothetical protein [uncultured Microbacterium sp.]